MSHVGLRAVAWNRKSGRTFVVFVTAVSFLLLLVTGVPGWTREPDKKVVTKFIVDGDFASAFASFEIGGQWVMCSLT